MTPQDHFSDIQQYHTCTITETIGRIKAAKQNERAARFEIETCQRESGGIKRVEKLCKVYVGIVTINLIYIHMDRLLSREPVKDVVIELLHSIVHGRTGLMCHPDQFLDKWY